MFVPFHGAAKIAAAPTDDQMVEKQAPSIIKFHTLECFAAI